MKKVLLHFLNLAGSYILLDGHAILYGKGFFFFSKVKHRLSLIVQ